MQSLAQIILFMAGVVSASVAFALVEIEIEGKNGWAAGLPTWRYQNRWTRRVLGARPITGYHLYFHLFVLVLAHLSYLLALVPPTLTTELRIIAFVLLFWVLEDFLWFVFNPAFGVRRFRRETIWWHADSWWGFMPRDYWIFTPLAIASFIASWFLP
jgi:hypothetical protein